MNAETVIFDFDGVLVESVDIKTEAFRTLFSFAPEHVDRIVQYHLDNTGISRYEKFHHIYESILHKDLPDETFRQLSDRFSSLVMSAVARAPYVPGAKEFLQRYSRSLLLFVISATPEEELKQIISKRGIGHFFRGIYGSPLNKEQNIRNLMQDAHLHPGITVYVGDAVNDLLAARKAAVRFIGRIRPGIENPFAGYSDVECTVHDLNDLSRYLEDSR